MSRKLLAIAVLALACSKTRRTPDDTIVVVIDGAMTTGDSRFAVNSHDSKLARLVGAGITAVDTQTLEPRLDLAAAMERGEPAVLPLPFESPLPLRLGDQVIVLTQILVVPVAHPTWIITLRDDVRFSDGTPVLADDVAYTFNSVLAKGSKSLHHKGFTERFWSVTATGPRTVRFVLKQPLATLPSDLDFAIVSHATGRGAGPYELRELTSMHALLTANPHYHGAKAKMPKVQFKFVRDAAARLLMLVGGSADLLQNAVRLDLVDEIKKRPRVKMKSAPSVILSYLMMNNADPLLRDRRVREAIALTIDRRAIIAAKFGGRARLANGLLPEMHWAYAKDLPTREHDIARAKQLLDEAGFRDPDGDGPRPRLSLVYKTSSDAFRLSIARIIAAQLGAAGIAVEVRSFEFATFFADVKKGIYQLASMQSAELNEPDYYYFYFHSSRIPDARNPDGGNRWRYRSDELDRHAEEGRREMDREKRKAIYAKAQHVVWRDLPIIPLWHEDNVVLANKELDGYALTPNARYIGLVNAVKRDAP